MIVEDRENIDKVKNSMIISRFTEVNPYPIQMYRNDTALGSRPAQFAGADSPTFGWLDDLARNTRLSLQRLPR